MALSQIKSPLFGETAVQRKTICSGLEHILIGVSDQQENYEPEQRYKPSKLWERPRFRLSGLGFTQILQCSSFLGKILHFLTPKPEQTQKGTTLEPLGRWKRAFVKVWVRVYHEVFGPSELHPGS